MIKEPLAHFVLAFCLGFKTACTPLLMSRGSVGQLTLLTQALLVSWYYFPIFTFDSDLENNSPFDIICEGRPETICCGQLERDADICCLKAWIDNRPAQCQLFCIPLRRRKLLLVVVCIYLVFMGLDKPEYFPTLPIIVTRWQFGACQQLQDT